MIFIIFAILALLAVDIGVTALALAMATGADSFWVSFWSGLAYSFWTGSLLSLVASLLFWRLQEQLQVRWRRSSERETMRRDAIGLANGLYAEFPAKPVFLTNSDSASARFEAEQAQMRERILAPLLADRAVECIPHVARRIHRRITSASPMVWSQGSPVGDLVFFFSQFITAYESTMDAARTLDYRLAYHARRLNRSPLDDIRTEADRCYFLGKLLGYADETLVSILAAEDAEEQRLLPQRYARLKKVAALEGPATSFAGGLGAIRQLLESFRDTPRTVPSDYRGLILTDPPWRQT